jgi:hypothetical protein
MKHICIALGLALMFPLAAIAQGGKLDTATIDKTIGKTGQMTGDVYKISFPRSDLHVTVNGVDVRPGLALGSWSAFRSTGTDAVAHGDLVLAESEVNPVISALQQGGFEITALHNHLINASQPILYLHFWGRGDAAKLSQTVKAALGRTKTPIANAPAPATTAPGFDADQFQQAVGLKGTVSNGVLAMSQARPEQIQMMGVTLPPAMGMATSINVQSAGTGQVAATGDFVMVADEVNKVARALREHDIAIAALHNHMLHGTPELYFMHFWAQGAPDKVAAGLKAALSELKK